MGFIGCAIASKEAQSGSIVTLDPIHPSIFINLKFVYINIEQFSLQLKVPMLQGQDSPLSAKET